MQENIRRILIFLVIVGAGTLLIFFDIPLLLILPLVVLIGVVLLIMLGALPLSEIKNLFRRKPAVQPKAAAPPKKAEGRDVPDSQVGQKKHFSFSLATLFQGRQRGKKTPHPEPQSSKTAPGAERKSGRFSQALTSFFRKKPSDKNTSAVPATAIRKNQDATEMKKAGFSDHIRSIASSFRQFGTIVKTKKEADPDKLKKIDTMLDAAVHQRPDNPPLSNPQPPATEKAGSSAGVAPLDAGAAGLSVGDISSDEDPFLSLADAELDAGLLDGLDDEDSFATPSPAAPADPGERASAKFTITLPEEGTISGEDTGTTDPVSQEFASAADDILKTSGAATGELPALEGLDSLDDGLDDLDSLTLDAVDLNDDDSEDENQAVEMDMAAPRAPASSVQPLPPAPAAEVPIKMAGSDQSEMAAFAAASSGDDDMLSSLAADIKSVRKEQDLSLLRELKDFRAPGESIEAELTDLYNTLNAAAGNQQNLRAKKNPTKPQAKK